MVQNLIIIHQNSQKSILHRNIKLKMLSLKIKIDNNSKMCSFI